MQLKVTKAALKQEGKSFSNVPRIKIELLYCFAKLYQRGTLPRAILAFGDDIGKRQFERA